MTALPLFAVALAGASRQKALDIIKAHTGSNPVSLRALQDRTGLSPRAIKQVVEFARSEGAPICARRGAPHGYYWASSDRDIRESTDVLVKQAKRMFWTVGRMLGSAEMMRLVGQLRLELEQESREGVQ